MRTHRTLNAYIQYDVYSQQGVEGGGWSLLTKRGTGARQDLASIHSHVHCMVLSKLGNTQHKYAKYKLIHIPGLHSYFAGFLSHRTIIGDSYVQQKILRFHGSSKAATW